MNKPSRNIPASILSRLLHYSRSNKQNYQSLLIRYVIERFLYRLGASKYKEQFILKGAYLLSITLEDRLFRATKDVDFLKTGETDSKQLIESIKEICSVENPDDGVKFDLNSIRMQEIREGTFYRGQRVKIKAQIGKAQITLQIDIGIGDSVYPKQQFQTVQPLLEHTAKPIILTYPMETVIAEKLEAIVSLSFLTSRMKDFYDLYILLTTRSFDYQIVKKALEKTFYRRKTELPLQTPKVLSSAILNDPTKLKQWFAFSKGQGIHQKTLTFESVILKIQDFTEPLWIENRKNQTITWLPSSGWNQSNLA